MLGGKNSSEMFAEGLLLRPGGLALTAKAVDFCGFPAGAVLADIGCGRGLTVDYLRDLGYEAYGLDSCGELLLGRDFCYLGRGDDLPFGDAAFDGLFFECSFSKMEPPSEVLREAYRVLKDGGKLVVSDLYARRKVERACGDACSGSDFAASEVEAAVLGRLDDEKTWYRYFEEAGFVCQFFEDESALLQNLAADILWELGVEGLRSLYGCHDLAEIKAADCGYFLSLWAKA